MDNLTLYYFSKEMRKEAVNIGQISAGLKNLRNVRFGNTRELGQGLWHGVREVGQQFSHLRNPAQALRNAANNLSGQSASAMKATKDFINEAANQGHRYTANTGSSVVDRLRRSGWMSNTPKYHGPTEAEQGLEWMLGKRPGAEAAAKPHTGRRVLNTAMRALPGRKAVAVGQGALGAAGELRSKETEDGRQKGLAERVGRAGAHLGVGLAGAQVASKVQSPSLLHGAGMMVGQSVAQSAASKALTGVGGGSGRVVDTLVKKRKPLVQSQAQQQALPTAAR